MAGEQAKVEADMGEEAGGERERERQRCDVILCSFIQEVLDRERPRNQRGLNQNPG